jgi:shikimate kinase
VENVILVGFMGTGKSAVGRMLAKRLKRDFVDLDERIEKDAGCAIPTIFAKEGEAGFRAREAKAVQHAAKLKNSVIATGGGVMLNEANVDALKKAGMLVCLTARPDVILQRTLGSISTRPLLAGENPKERIEELLKLREPFYARADISIETSDRTIEAVVDEIQLKLTGK